MLRVWNVKDDLKNGDHVNKAVSEVSDTAKLRYMDWNRCANNICAVGQYADGVSVLNIESQ